MEASCADLAEDVDMAKEWLDVKERMHMGFTPQRYNLTKSIQRDLDAIMWISC